MAKKDAVTDVPPPPPPPSGAVSDAPPPPQPFGGVTDVRPPPPPPLSYQPQSRIPEQDQPKGTPEGEASSYPVSFRENSDAGRYEAMLREKWKDQGRVKCAHKRCHYPLNLVKDINKNVISMNTPEGPALKAVCSWDPAHEHPEGGAQYILEEALKANEEKGE